MTERIEGYEKYWKRVLGFVKENDNLSLEELWNQLNWWDLMSPEKWRDEETAKQLKFDFMVDGKSEKISLYDIANRRKQYISDKIYEQFTDETDVIIELGAGWGRNIFSLIMSEKYDCEYISGEGTMSGTNTCQLISDRFGLDVITVQHDFTDEDSSSVIDLIKKKKFKNVLIFTSFSIEQIAYLRENFFDEFLELDLDSLRFVHIEPILNQIRIYRGENIQPVLNDYNKNLYSMLRRLESEGKIKITEVNEYGFRIGKNAGRSFGSLVTWEKV